MPEIALQIDQPANGATFVPAVAETTVQVAMSGTVLSTDHEPAPLFFVWYSSVDGELERATAITPSLSVGTHVITFTAKDQNDDGVAEEDLRALYESVVHIGAAGGAPPESEAPRVIHVFKAHMVAPTGGASLSISNPDLEAQAPVNWAELVAEGPPREYGGKSERYHAVNALRYRWLLLRVGDPVADTVEVDLRDGDALELFEADANRPTRLRFTGTLPGSLIVGDSYEVTLRVEHEDDPSIGDQVTLTVTMAA